MGKTFFCERNGIRRECIELVGKNGETIRRELTTDGNVFRVCIRKGGVEGCRLTHKVLVGGEFVDFPRCRTEAGYQVVSEE